MIKQILRPFIFICLLCYCNFGFSQQTFQRLYGGVNQEISLVALPCPSGGIYYLGATTSTGNGEADPVIMKLDDNGQVLWAHTIGGPNYDVAGAMTLAADGGLVYAGSTKSYNGNTLDDLYFFKTDSTGSLQWAKTFSTSDLDVASALLRTSDGGFAITGFIRVAGLKRVLLIRTDSNGDTLYTRTYGSGLADDQGVEFFETADGGFVITGKTFTQTSPESDILLMRTDAQGNLLWAKSYGDVRWDEGGGITRLLDGNYLLSGSTISFGQGDFDILLMKLDTTGTILWGKTYGGTKSDAAYTARENADGSILTSGYSNSMGYGHSLRRARPQEVKQIQNTGLLSQSPSPVLDVQSQDRGDDSTNVFLMKVNAVGDTLWTRSYGDGAQDEAFHFYKMNDGGYILPGFSTSYTNTTDSTQMMLIRTDSLGHSGCHEQDAHPMIDTTNFTTQNLTFNQSPGITVNNVVSNSLAWSIPEADACLLIKVSENQLPDITVSPNPAVNTLNISSGNYPFTHLGIYNLLGEPVLDYDVPAQFRVSADVSNLASGIYFLKLVTPASEATKKIIIQKN